MSVGLCCVCTFLLRQALPLLMVALNPRMATLMDCLILDTQPKPDYQLELLLTVATASSQQCVKLPQVALGVNEVVTLSVTGMIRPPAGDAAVPGVPYCRRPLPRPPCGSPAVGPAPGSADGDGSSATSHKRACEDVECEALQEMIVEPSTSEPPLKGPD